MTMNVGKTADLIETLFGVVDRVGTRNDVLNGVADPPHSNRKTFGGNGSVYVTYRENVALAMQTWLN